MAAMGAKTVTDGLCLWSFSKHHADFLQLSDSVSWMKL
jgi:hypothetical protein